MFPWLAGMMNGLAGGAAGGIGGLAKGGVMGAGGNSPGMAAFGRDIVQGTNTSPMASMPSVGGFTGSGQNGQQQAQAGQQMPVMQDPLMNKDSLLNGIGGITSFFGF